MAIESVVLNDNDSSGAEIAVDTISVDGSDKSFQIIKLASGLDGSTDTIQGDSTFGLDVDVTRVVPGTGATHLGKAEDAVHASGDVGVMMLGVRRDTAASGAGTDGDYATFNFNSTGYLYTSDINGAAALTALQLIDDAYYTDSAVFTVESSKVVAIAGHVDDSASTNVSEGDVGAVRMSADRALHTILWDAAGNNRGLNIDSGGRLGVAEISTSVTPGTAAGNLGKAVDAIAGAADTGVAMLAVRKDTPATLTPVDGDYTTLRVSSLGALHTVPTTTQSIFRSLDLDETEEDVKTSAGKVFGWYFYNAASSVRYVKFYNATAANVTVGTTTPVLTLPLPATSAGHVEFTRGIPFATAISVAATTALADNDTGAPSAGDVTINILYE